MLRLLAEPGEGFADLEWAVAILTVAEFRARVTTSASDAAIQALLDAAEAEIVRYAGASGTVTDLIDGGWPHLILSRPASSITSITETVGTTVTTLAVDDYRIRAQGYYLERLTGGTHSRSRWHGLVTVVYSTASDTALREAVQVELVQLDLNLTPGLKSEGIGDYNYTEADASKSTDEQRAEILSRLLPEPGMRVVGEPVSVWR